MRERSNIKIKEELTQTWETKDKVIEQFYEDDISDTQEIILYILKKFPETERQIFLLYSEYNSYRKVAKETNISYGTIKTIIDKIKKEIKNAIATN